MTVSRRDLIRSAAAAAFLGQMTAQEAQHVHEHVAQKKAANSGVYTPQTFNPQEWATVVLLADLVIPPQDTDPGGAAAGAPEFIDVLCNGSEKMAEIWLGGLSWVNWTSNARYGSPFPEASAAQRTELLDLIAFRKNEAPGLGPGSRFFDWVRRMVVDGWATSPAGTKAIGYMGNTGMQTFQVPEAALRYVIDNSPFKPA